MICGMYWADYFERWATSLNKFQYLQQAFMVTLLLSAIYWALQKITFSLAFCWMQSALYDNFFQCHYLEFWIFPWLILYNLGSHVRLFKYIWAILSKIKHMSVEKQHLDMIDFFLGHLYNQFHFYYWTCDKYHI